MGTEMVLCAMGSWTFLGWLLDAQRAVACASRAIPRAWLF